VLRGEQHEDEVDRLSVEGIERHRLVQPRKQAHHARKPAELGVRDAHAAPQPGRSELLAMPQRLEDVAGVEARKLSGALAEFL